MTPFIQDIFHDREVEGSEAFRTVYLAWMDFMDNKLVGETFPNINNYSVFYSKCEDKVIGVLSYYHTGNNIGIFIAYVLPEFRRRGVYSTLLNSLKEFCENNHIRTIWSGVDAKNEASLAAHSKAGFKIKKTQIGMEYAV